MTKKPSKPQSAVTHKRLRHHLSQPLQQYAMFAVAIVLAVATGLAVLYVLRIQRQDTQAVRQIQAASALTLTARRDAGAREIMTGKPIEGKRGLILTVTVTNNTNQPQTFIPTHQTFIRDGLGHTYKLTPLDEIKHPIAGGKLRPGQSRSGELSYVVDNNATQLRFYFDGRWSDAAPVVIDL